MKKRLRVLIACEFSGIVRDAFAARGHDAWSCDLLPTERPGKHIQGDVLEVLDQGWDLMIAFPPCTFLCISGARWWKDKGRQRKQDQALTFVRKLLNAPIDRIALENPVGCIGTRIRPSDQIIQPWMFGHGEIKKTCFWLKNLDRLIPTRIVKGRRPRVHYDFGGISGRAEQWKYRSRTLSGIANAMAIQWGNSSKVPGYFTSDT
jgi:hypothetical protein